MDKIEALLWDADGVLVDTEPLNWWAWKGLFAELGHPVTLAEYLPMVGYGGQENLAALCRLRGITPAPDPMSRRRWEIYRTLTVGGVPPIQPNVALVRAFAQHDPAVRQVVVSSSLRSNIEGYLVTTRLTDVISQIICPGDRPTLRRKPAPDLYLLALEQLGLPASAGLVFEDSEPGVLAAKAAGLRCVALPNTFTLGQNFSPADLVIIPGKPRNVSAILNHLAQR